VLLLLLQLLDLVYHTEQRTADSPTLEVLLHHTEQGTNNSPTLELLQKEYDCQWHMAQKLWWFCKACMYRQPTTHRQPPRL
jgi:hypothetical protein